ncbi:hypothetical protein [Persicobacter diffluens]|uniref:Uncharacterized protein n=1 Tax=Persicobacter diffluens TaxID=981 RepID=A0AAN4VZH8_9BACT|nr:hypothetical protein PEDI_34680 [Persicobacter diffluens]
MTKYIIQVIMFFVLISCQNDEFGYTYLSSYYLDGEPITLTGQTDNDTGLETNDWNFDLTNGKNISKGRFLEGMRIDNWIYTLHRDTSMVVDWIIFRDPIKGIKMSYPKIWHVNKETPRVFEATFETVSPIKRSKFFAVTYNIKDSIKMNMKEYLDYSTNKLAQEERLKRHYTFEIATDKDTTYYSITKLVRNNENIMILDYLFEKDDKIIELTYSTLDIETEFKNQIFLDIVSCFYYEQKRAFDPLTRSEIIIKL